MGNDALKNRERFSTTLDKQVVKELKEYSQNTMIPISKILDRAITEYIKGNPK
jgi:metal-responsive CopG/Arc/MetJ family transcriptional regulator